MVLKVLRGAVTGLGLDPGWRPGAGPRPCKGERAGLQAAVSLFTQPFWRTAQ